MHKLSRREQGNKTPRPLRRHPVAPASRKSSSCSSFADEPLEKTTPLDAATTRVGTGALARPAERSSASLGSAHHPFCSRNTELLRQRQQRMQHVVQFIRVPHIRPGLFPHLCDCSRIELPHLLQHRLGQHTPHL